MVKIISFHTHLSGEGSVLLSEGEIEAGTLVREFDVVNGEDEEPSTTSESQSNVFLLKYSIRFRNHIA